MTRFVFLLTLLLALGCARQQELTRIAPTYYPIDGENRPVDADFGEALTVAPSTYDQRAGSIDSIVAPYQSQLNAQMSEQIGSLPQALQRFGDQPTLGYWVGDLLAIMADKYYDDHNIDFAIQNAGGLRIPELPAGTLTVGQIYELMPFDNVLVVLEIKGTTVQELVDRMAASGGWPSSEALTYTIQDKKGIDTRINGAPLDPSATYYVAMPDYVANGGSGCDFLTDSPQFSTGQYIRDVIIEYAKQETAAGRAIEGRMESGIRS